MNSRDVKKYLKSKLLIRFLAWPYMTLKKKKDYERYIVSEDHYRIQEYKNKYIGKRCFIVGNGPSLRVEDLNKIYTNKDISMGANYIYTVFEKTKWRPNYYFCQDPDALELIIPTVEKFNDIDGIFIDIDGRKYEKCNNPRIIHTYWTNKKYVINRYNDKSSHISVDVSKYFSIGYTVLFSALQFAIYCGINEIYLLGIDFNYSRRYDKWGRIHINEDVNDYFDRKTRRGAALIYESTLYAWQQAKEYGDKHGIMIKNATRGGNLEVFDRVSFDSLF